MEAFLLSCPSLGAARTALEQYTANQIEDNSVIQAVVYQCLEDEPVQQYGEGLLAALFKLSRNYCHGLHKSRKLMLENENE